MKKYEDAIPCKRYNDDLYIVEFPKSGITWLTFLIANTNNLIEKNNIDVTFFNINNFIPDIHIYDNKITYRKIYKTFPRIFKSHSSFNPYYKNVIYLVRNPIDVMKSYYKMAYNRFNYKEDFFTFIKSQNYGIEAYVKHLESWILSNKTQHFILIKYEDLEANTFDTLKILYTILGHKNIDNCIKIAIDKSSMINMKNIEILGKKYNPRVKNDKLFVGSREYDNNKVIITDEIKEYIYEKSNKIYNKVYEN